MGELRPVFKRWCVEITVEPALKSFVVQGLEERKSQSPVEQSMIGLIAVTLQADIARLKTIARVVGTNRRPVVPQREGFTVCDYRIQNLNNQGYVRTSCAE